MKLLIKKIVDESIIPFQAHEGDAGIDLFSIEEAVLKPFERKLIHTGIKIQLPHNTEEQLTNEEQDTKETLEKWNNFNY